MTPLNSSRATTGRSNAQITHGGGVGRTRFPSNLAALFLGIGFLAGGSLVMAAADSTQPMAVGVAQVDITPEYPVRLNGFGGRRTESEGVTQKIWAKAIAFGDVQLGPAVIITTDNLG